MSHDWLTQVRDLTLTLVRFPSVTGTPGEREFAGYIRDVLAAHPYFQAHPAHLRLEPIPDDPHGRANVFALVRGSGAATVVLAGHYDVVSAGNYGDLEPWAFDPEALLPRLRAALEAGHSEAETDTLALADLRGGDYLPGRGALDMKSGLAAGIAVLYRFAESTQRTGNLLFMTTPDEEATSYGMRAAVLRLPGLAREWGLEPIAAINLDSEGDRGDGHDGRAVFLGSVGKLLPSVYVVGRETHAGAPFDGINATLLAAEITRHIECNVALSDSAAGEVAPPPTCLTQIDLKPHYDVTTPVSAWCTYNVLSYARTAAEVLATLREVVAAALDAAVAQVAEQARRYAERTGRPAPPPAWQPRVLTFAVLKALALRRGGPATETALADLTARLQDDPQVDLPQLSRRLTELLWGYSGLTGPAAVLGVAALYYPRVHLDGATPRQTRLREAAVRQAAAVTRVTGVGIRPRPFFPGISDMSFLGGTEASADLAVLAANTPAWGSRIRFDYAAAQALDLPAINVGPWGRDYHQRTERVNVPYSFGIVPELIWRIAGDLLDW
jgi:arginine utilization protein RocB